MSRAQHSLVRVGNYQGKQFVYNYTADFSCLATVFPSNNLLKHAMSPRGYGIGL